ncbi:response regulator transcription factor [Streptomyces sp. CRN 30]|uniref:response regulator transcription factor n=1 Tax=Streptomyces sp. CRN 30 TaxID=3075613 RepID=UPI002A812CAD|nr:response regulator transcription factor [Streptomyces sp. CRN 30]
MSGEEGLRAVGCTADPANVRRMVAEHRPHVVVVLDDGDTRSAVQALAGSVPRPRVLAVSAGRRRAAQENARDGVDLPVNRIDRASLIPAIRLVRSGYQVAAGRPDAEESAPPQRRSDVARRFDQLTARETDVVQLMLRGWSNDEIAAALELSRATVKSHVHSLMGKLDLNSRIDVITMAYRTGLVRPGGSMASARPCSAPTTGSVA